MHKCSALYTEFVQLGSCVLHDVHTLMTFYAQEIMHCMQKMDRTSRFCVWCRTSWMITSIKICIIDRNEAHYFHALLLMQIWFYFYSSSWVRGWLNAGLLQFICSIYRSIVVYLHAWIQFSETSSWIFSSFFHWMYYIARTCTCMGFVQRSLDNLVVIYLLYAQMFISFIHVGLWFM